MSYQEKRTIAMILSGAILMAAYCFYTFGKYAAGGVAPTDLKFWALNMLMFIGIGIVVTIIIQIVFHILLSIAIAVKEKIQDDQCDEEIIEKTIKAEMVEDEMDKLIELKASNVGYIAAGVGLVAGLFTLVFDQPAMVMLNIAYLSMMGGSILEGIVRLIYYRRGVHHA